MKDIQCVKDFPMQDFIFIFKLCFRLSFLHVTAAINEDMDAFIVHDPEPFLTYLRTDSIKLFIPKASINYITKRLVNVSCISFQILPQPMSMPLLDTYGQLLGHLLESPKDSVNMETSMDWG